MNWEKYSKTETSDGTTIIYACDDITSLHIESRKRHIPHANGREGTWDHTSYFVVSGKKDLKELHSLRDAREWAEEYINGKTS